ncbi:hydroxymethylglutaryl-CoA lyase [Rhodococcus wratislaviensis]|uniref:Hydroxymethylglutaryl-CoA lyase n=1 Tax=Rhodococcus wratislaviensis TaxID=44752 RepID=A0AB38FCY6_RHOWR|nr:citramalate synthase [Rhodococcus wratislaviensis]REE75480.1 hydroxymethylglutaryl-CoA lyase [Rhodococcus wratislaviensis]SPZ39485.1 hydroxymethylglutaryl-CoA lyase [Rhodococcus wratislaviensis]
MSGLPTITITEEVMREGMQIESAGIPVADKIRLLNSLSRTGLRRIVVGSFVSPRYTPQMAEMERILDGLEPQAGVQYIARAFNAKGRERAAQYTPPLSQDVQIPRLHCHFSDIFVRRNYNRSQADEIAGWPDIVARAVANSADSVGIGIGAAFGSNFGDFPGDHAAFAMLERQAALWDEAGIPVTSVFLSDPMGWVMPHVIETQLNRILERWPAITNVRLHLHDSRGLALASTYVAIRTLDERHTLELDTTVGGIGGCPYGGNGRATGMAPTEDLVNLLNMMGVDTGVDIDALIDFAWQLEKVIGRPLGGQVSKAGPHPMGHNAYSSELPVVETLEEARHFRLGTGVIKEPRWPWLAAARRTSAS